MNGTNPILDAAIARGGRACARAGIGIAADGQELEL